MARARTALLAAALVVGAPAAALAFGGNSDAGSGLSPYAALNGNDRSAGVNNGNYRPPRFDPYVQTYGYEDEPRVYRRAPTRRPAYGYPY